MIENKTHTKNQFLPILIGIEILLGLFLVIIFLIKPLYFDFLKWHYKSYLCLFLLSPLASILWLYHTNWKREALKNWHGLEEIDLLEKNNDISFGNLSIKRRFKRFLCFKLGLIFLIFSVLGPESGGEMVESTSEGIELVIALDLSPSMMAEDISPNRLGVAKTAIKNTINQLDGDLVGLVVFSGRAYTQLPLSNDYGSAKTYINSVNINTINTKGTALSEAILEGNTLFTEESAASKVILIFTDGEDHEGELEDALSEAKGLGIKVSCVAMGSEAGAPIPDDSGNNKYKQDRTGNTVISKTNRKLLDQICSSSDGERFDIQSGSLSEVRKIAQYVQNEQTAETGTFSFSNLTPRFQFPLIISILFLVLFILFKEKDTPWM